MRARAIAVIGANYGDEGKGAAVDRLVSGPSTLVVRHNGGAQAGHTVMTPDGRRHVFSHVGAGAFLGAATFLSRFFVANPALLEIELAELESKEVRPRIFADRRALLTSPYDVAINRIIEQTRGAGRHGSCGIGFGETIERAENGFATTVGDAERPSLLAATMRRARDEWAPRRLATLGIRSVPDEYRALLAGDGPIEAFLESAAKFARAVEIGSDEPLREATDVVFEGAQGLLLDQDRGEFPYVTRSNTGLLNVLSLAKETGIDALEAVYATRCYLTRHGAGPLPMESGTNPFKVVDPTNAPNPWQGTLRFAPLDVGTFAARVRQDVNDATGTGVLLQGSVAVCCLDQAPDIIPAFSRGKAIAIPKEKFASDVASACGFASHSSSWGPARQDAASAPDLVRCAEA